jgi:hypothetical protein
LRTGNDEATREKEEEEEARCFSTASGNLLSFQRRGIYCYKVSQGTSHKIGWGRGDTYTRCAISMVYVCKFCQKSFRKEVRQVRRGLQGRKEKRGGCTRCVKMETGGRDERGVFESIFLG